MVIRTSLLQSLSSFHFEAVRNIPNQVDIQADTLAEAKPDDKAEDETNELANDQVDRSGVKGPCPLDL